LDLCEQALAQENRFPEHAEVAAFVIYHHLIDDFDLVITEPNKTQEIWKKYYLLWERHFPEGALQPTSFDHPTLFALFYQIRRAFHWIFHFVIVGIYFQPRPQALREWFSPGNE
jgi:hypothetical protein